jgi:isopentenyl-diphosphate Delta-isomerase
MSCIFVLPTVDHILFLTADVNVTPNANEIRDYKYVDNSELQAMFADPTDSFTPWFKLIAQEFLFGWWDTLVERRVNGVCDAQRLFDLADTKVHKMI